MIYDPHNLLPLAHIKLRSLVRYVGVVADVQIVTTYRDPAAQQEAFDTGKSHARPGQSPHNFNPSLAVDMVPHPVNWNDRDAFIALGALTKKLARQNGISITWGGDFSNLVDMPHFELLNWQQIVMQIDKEKPDGNSV